MSVFKRALVQVRANIGKSILIFIIFLMTMGIVVATFMVTTVYNKTLTETFKDDVVPLYVAPDYSSKMFEMGGGGYDESKIITPQQYFDFSELDSVESSDINLNSVFNTDQLKIPGEEGEYSADILYTKKPESISKYYGDDVFQLDYDKEAFKSDPNSIIISEKVLADNELEVGDKITLDINPESDDGQTRVEFEAVEFNIIGSYTVTPTDEMMSTTMEDGVGEQTFDYLLTTSIIPRAMGEQLLAAYGENSNVLNASATYYVPTIEDKVTFENEVEAITGVPVKVGFDLFNSSENKMATALSTIASLREGLNYIIVFFVVVIIVLLTVIITMFVRGRKKELGILVALGESKHNIYAQLLIEQTIILVLAIVAAYPIVLIALNFGAKKYGYLKLGFTIMPFIQSLVVGVVIIGLITIVPAIYTLRLKPKKILL